MKKSPSLIYSRDYYRMEKLIRDKRFKERVQWLRGEYTRLNHPIPQKGFKDYKQYAQWITSFRLSYYDTKRVELDKKILEIKSSKTLNSSEKARKIDNERHRSLPLEPNFFVENIMEEFGINKDNDKLFSFILWHIFLGKEHLSESIVKATLKQNDKGVLELFIAVLPHTKLKHIKDNWKEIERLQKYLPGYIGKNKEQKEFDRNLHIYHVYQKVKTELANGHIDEFGRHRVDEITWGNLYKEDKKYENMSLEQIRQSVSIIADLGIL